MANEPLILHPANEYNRIGVKLTKFIVIFYLEVILPIASETTYDDTEITIPSAI